MNPLFRIDFSISDSLKIVRKSVLIYETIIYYVDTVGKNTKAIKEYIADQLKRDQDSDQISMFDPRDPFMGSK